jgi:hypothetical protein
VGPLKVKTIFASKGTLAALAAGLEATKLTGGSMTDVDTRFASEDAEACI